MRRYRSTFIFPLLVVLALLLAALAAGCREAGEADETTTSNRLIVYSGRSESLVAPIIEQFAKVSGINVDVRYGGTAELAVTLLEEGENSPADLSYAQDPARFASANGQWIGISGRARVIVYNTETVSPADLPDDLWGSVEPEWKGRIGWAPTNGSFQAMVTGMHAMWGKDKTRQWLSAIQANEPIAYERNTPIVAAVAAGEVEVGFVNHYYLHRF